MATGDDILADLRRQIDGIDDALHDLILRRAALVEHVREAKQGDDPAYFRPGREADILRRLLDRHEGTLPPGVIVRMWREMITAFVSLQGPLSVAVLDGEDGAYWDIARDHFGAGAPIRRHATPRGVVQAVADRSALVGVLSTPHAGDPDPWWPLLDGAAANVRICARLPFIAGGNSRGGQMSVLAVAVCPPEETGEDRSFLVVDCAEALSRSRLTTALGRAGLTHHMIVEDGRGVSGGTVPYLIEVDGFIFETDAVLEALVEAEERIVGLRAVGACAMPPGLRWDGSQTDTGR